MGEKTEMGGKRRKEEDTNRGIVIKIFRVGIWNSEGVCIEFDPIYSLGF